MEYLAFTDGDTAKKSPAPKGWHKMTYGPDVAARKEDLAFLTGVLLREHPTPSTRPLPLQRWPLRDDCSTRFAGVGGSEVLSVGGKPAEKVFDALRPIVPMDNEMGLKTAAPLLMRIPEVLHALGVTNSPERATWEFTTSNGEHMSVQLEPVTQPEGMSGISAQTSVDAREASEAPIPLYLKSPNDAFWFEYLQDERIVHVQCNSVRDKIDETLELFYGRVFAFVDEHPVEKMVLDIRNNGGGNNLLNQPLIHGLICCDKVNKSGRLFTIVGRRPFSAAMNLANDLEKHTNTVFVGGPTGSSPNHFGDAREHRLPNISIAFHVSTLYWQYSVPQDSKQWIVPVIPAELSSKDYRSNRDPAMEAILSVEPASIEVKPFAERLYSDNSSGPQPPARGCTQVMALSHYLTVTTGGHIWLSQ